MHLEFCLAAARSSLRITTQWLLGFMLAVAVTAAQANSIYVAPQGDDANPGTQAKPFASLPRALQALRKSRQLHPDKSVEVVLRGGTYSIETPLQLTADDSGRQGAGVTFRAAENEKPVVSGGVTLSGWRVDTDGRWKLDIPAVRDGKWFFRELFVNGRRATRARCPDDGYFRMAKVGPDQRTSFTYQESDLTDWPAPGQIELVFLHDWSASRAKVQSIDTVQRELTLAQPVGQTNARHYAMDWFEPRPRYFLENHSAFLSKPGEWYLDREAGVLTYWPRPGEQPESSQAVAPRATSLLHVDGAHHVAFRGITFAHTQWLLPPGGCAGVQAAFHQSRPAPGKYESGREAKPPAVLLDRCQDCEFEKCAFRNLGASGIWIRQSCQRVRLRDSTLEDISANGLLVGETWRSWKDDVPITTDIDIANNRILRCGQQYFGAVGIWVGFAARVRIIDNEVAFLPYTGISLGWKSDPSPTPCREHLVQSNQIHQVMQVLSDGGGIYTLGRQPGTVLRANMIYDVPPNAGRAESNGMFLDEGTSEIVIADNVIYNVGRSPLRFHKAGENLVQSNHLHRASEDVPQVRYNATEPKNITLQTNHDYIGEDGLQRLLETIKALTNKDDS